MKHSMKHWEWTNKMHRVRASIVLICLVVISFHVEFWSYYYFFFTMVKSSRRDEMA